MEYIKLNNGLEIPKIGLGTFMQYPDEAEESTYWALTMGYKLIDTANVYLNEKAVGRGISKSYKDRDDIFISTKIWPSEYENPNAVNETLERLGLDYIDLLFLHQPAGNYIKGYKMLEKAYKEGKIKAIGLSNFDEAQIRKISESCEIMPQVIQVEAHPYCAQDELRNIVSKYDIKVMSWYPLGHGDKNLMEEPIFKRLAMKYGKTPVQIILRWHLDMGFIVIPGSKNPEHIKSNLDILDFKLSIDDLIEISKLNKDRKYYNETKGNLARYSLMKLKYEDE